MHPLPSLPGRSKKGLLTPENCVVGLIDLQPRMLDGVAHADRRQLLDNNLMLAKAAALFGVPTLLSCMEAPGAGAAFAADVHAVFPTQALHLRTAINSWDDAAFAATVTALGRNKLILAGLWTATCIALPAIEAIEDGYDVYVVEDCCGDASALAHENAMQRMIQSGVRPVTALSVMLEWQRDWALLETSAAVRDIARAHSGAFARTADLAAAPHPVPAASHASRVPQPVLPGYLGQPA